MLCISLPYYWESLNTLHPSELLLVVLQPSLEVLQFFKSWETALRAKHEYRWHMIDHLLIRVWLSLHAANGRRICTAPPTVIKDHMHKIRKIRAHGRGHEQGLVLSSLTLLTRTRHPVTGVMLSYQTPTPDAGQSLLRDISPSSASFGLGVVDVHAYSLYSRIVDRMNSYSLRRLPEKSA